MRVTNKHTYMGRTNQHHPSVDMKNGKPHFVLPYPDAKGKNFKYHKAVKAAIVAYAGFMDKYDPVLAGSLRQNYVPTVKRKAIIRKGTGIYDNQFRFILVGDNGEPVGGSNNEWYYSKQSAVDTLREYYPGFRIVDKSKVSKRVSDAELIQGIFKTSLKNGSK